MGTRGWATRGRGPLHEARIGRGPDTEANDRGHLQLRSAIADSICKTIGEGASLPRLEGLCDTAPMTQDRIGGATDRHREAFETLQTAILAGDKVAVTPADVRRGAAERGDVPERFAAYVDTIHDHAYRISDRTLTDLRTAGASEDEVFEVTVSAAFGAARERLEVGLAAVRDATRAAT